MRYLIERLRRGRRRNRIPHGLLVTAAMTLILAVTLMLSASLLALPASARSRIRMPRTGDGIVTDGDGIIDSTGIAGDVPDVTDLLPDGSMNDVESGTGTGEGSDALDPTVSGTGESGSDAGTTDPETTKKETTRADATTNAVDDAADAMGISPWVIGLILLAVIVGVVILIVWWATGSRRH